VIVGLPGVGKTTVLNKSVELLKERQYIVKVVNFGDFMFKYLLNKGLIKTRDDIRKLPLSQQRTAQQEAAKEIRKVFEEEAAEVRKYVGFVDTHALIKTPTGNWPGLPAHVIEELRPDSIIVVEAKPEEIVSRQLRDKTRYRADYAKVNLIEELLKLNRIFAISSAVLVGASVNFIHNKEGKLEEAAKEIADIVENI